MKAILSSRLFLFNLGVQTLFASGLWLLLWSSPDIYIRTVIAAVMCVVAGVATCLTTHASYKNTLAKLQLYSEGVATSTSQMVEATHLVSSASTQQAASIQETVATVTEMNTTISKSVDNAKRSFEFAERSKQVAAEGHHAVTDMIKAIDHISESNNNIVAEIDTSNERITNIVKVIMEISNKTKVINDIVFQTKLLSFNASVEAARAGEHGKGFAVVAEEIGNLAQMSGNASREISEMLQGSIKKVNGIVEDTSTKVRSLVHEGKEKVNDGIKVAHRCGEILQEVVTSVTLVNNMISEISQASQEQSLGMNEIAQAMAQLDLATQQNADTAQNLAEYSADISAQTERFGETLRTFNSNSVSLPEVQKSKASHGQKNKVSQPLEFKRIPTGKKRALEPVHKAKKVMGSDVPVADSPEFEDV